MDGDRSRQDRHFFKLKESPRLKRLTELRWRDRGPVNNSKRGVTPMNQSLQQQKQQQQQQQSQNHTNFKVFLEW